MSDYLQDITFEIEGVETIDFGIGAEGAIPSVNSVNGKTGTVVLVTSDLTNDSNYQNASQVASSISTHNASTEAHADIRSAVSGKYTKPNTGIPENDLSSEVQTKLNSAINNVDDVYVNGVSVLDADKIAQVTVPTKTSDITNDSGFLTSHQSLEDYAKKVDSGYKVALDMDSSTYIITPKLYNKANELISTGTPIDLPLESVVVSGSYDSVNKKIVLTLSNGSTIDVPVGDLINGLVSTTTFNNHANNTTVHISAQDRSSWDAKYTLPDTGLPYNSLAEGVKASLDKADTALQEHQSLTNYATKVWVEDKGYLTQHQSLSAYRTSAAQDVIDATFYVKGVQGIPKTDLTSQVQTSLGKADTALQSITLATSSDIGGIKADEALATDTQPVRINAQGKLVTAPVGGESNAIQGVIFNGTELVKDANNKVSFSAITSHQSLSAYRTSADQDVIDAEKYEKPNTGIPKTDLASAVQTSLGKADTALQEHQSLAGYATENFVEEYHDSTKQNLITSSNKLSYNLLSDTPTIPVVPTTLSSFTDDLGSDPVHTHSQYLTEHQSLSAYRTASDQDVIDLTKASVTNLNAHTGNTSNPHGVTKAQVGLGNVPNTDFTSTISEIQGKIPSQATSSNQLADKNFVNSSIATATATFRGTYESLAELLAYTGDKDNNDYAFVGFEDEYGYKGYKRYKYVVPSSGVGAWTFEYILNHSSFTAAQWSAINSGVTDTKVGTYDTHIANTNIHVTTANKETWNAKQDALTNTDTEIQDAVSKKHEHSNKALLDTYNQTNANLTDAVSKKHNHTNKTELDLIADGDKAKWDAKSTVSVAVEGTSTEKVNYITIDGTEKKLGGTEVSVSSTGRSTDVVKYITINGTEKQLGGGEVDDVQVRDKTTGTYSSVVVNKIAKIESTDGIHIGTSAPTQGETVWINPNGDPSSFVDDSSTSSTTLGWSASKLNGMFATLVLLNTEAEVETAWANA